jgi:hypothetical protein
MKQRKPKLVKASVIKPVKTPRTPASPKSLHRLQLDLKAARSSPKSQKRDNIFSKSPDTRKNRGARKAKTTRPTKLLFRFCAML